MPPAIGTSLFLFTRILPCVLVITLLYLLTVWLLWTWVRPRTIAYEIKLFPRELLRSQWREHTPSSGQDPPPHELLSSMPTSVLLSSQEGSHKLNVSPVTLPVLFVVAHPDDECMFFAPTIQVLMDDVQTWMRHRRLHRISYGR